MTHTEDTKKVESEGSREGKGKGGRDLPIGLQKGTRTQHATKIDNGTPGKQMKLEYSFSIGQNKMKQ